MEKLKLDGIYRLNNMIVRAKMAGDHRLYDSKGFSISVNENNEMDFIDVESNQTIRLTTAVVNHSVSGSDHLLVTSSGSVYNITEIHNDVPDSEMDDPETDDLEKALDQMGSADDEQTASVEVPANEVVAIPTEQINDIVNDDSIPPVPEDFPELVSKENVSRQINYGDGYYGSVYRFAEPMTYDQFLDYCRMENNDLSHLNSYEWWQDHPLVTPTCIKSGDRISHDNREGKKDDVSSLWTYLLVKPYTD